MSQNKYDKRLVAGQQDFEVDYVVQRMREKEGIETNTDEVREIIKEHGHSRRRLYAIIRERRKAEFEAKAQEGNEQSI